MSNDLLIHFDWSYNFWTYIQVVQELKDSIASYDPLEEMKIPQVNILLIGQVGSGKSSFLNTINPIFKGEISFRACTGGAENSLTQKVIYPLFLSLSLS